MDTNKTGLGKRKMSDIYAGVAGIRNLVLLIVMFVGFGITIGYTQGQIEGTETKVQETSETSEENKETLGEIKSDIRLLKDDQGEIEDTLVSHGVILNRQVILLERLATRLNVSTKPEE